MYVKSIIKAILIGGAMLGMVGCASSGKRHASASETSMGMGELQRFYGEEITPAQEKALLAKRTIYFGYDRYDLSDEDRLVLLAHSRQLANNPNMHIRLEGHTDERGSREYNVGLGERRANAGRNIMRMKGVHDNQLAIVSFGKEKPAALGHDEGTWSKNRRAEIVYESGQS